MIHPRQFLSLLLGLFLFVVPALAQDATPTATPSGEITSLSTLPVIGPSASVDVSGVDLRRDGYGITNIDILTLRTGAGTAYQPLALLEGGVYVNVTGRNETDTWLQVATGNGFAGWLRANGDGIDTFVIRRGNLSGIPVIPESEMGIKAPATLVTSRLNTLYTTASASTPLCQLAEGEFIVNGSNNVGDWLQIVGTCTDGQTLTGWVMETDGALRNPSGGLLPILDSGITSGTALQPIEGPAFVFFYRRQLYATPSELGDYLCFAAPGRYAIVGRTEDISWYQIEATCFDGTATVTGWLPSTEGFFQTTNNARVPVTG